MSVIPANYLFRTFKSIIFLSVNSNHVSRINGCNISIETYYVSSAITMNELPYLAVLAI